MKTVDHIALLVDDLDESQKWYEENAEAVCVFNDKFYKRMKVSNTTIALVCKNHYDYNHVGILVDNKEDFSHELNNAIANDNEGLRLERMELAKEYSWEKRFNQMNKYIINSR